MKDFEINGLHFRFDNGCLHLMREARGTKESNPLDGMTDSEEISVLIMYGGLGRVEMKQDRPISRTLEDCKKLLFDFSPSETGKMVMAWNKALTVGDEEDVKDQVDGEEKKS